MFKTENEIIRTLEILNDYYHIASRHVIILKQKKPPGYDTGPFNDKFFNSIEKRKELLRRLCKLEKNEKTVLLLFYTFSKTIDHIAGKLNLSQRQCYRIKKRAIEKLLSEKLVEIVSINN